MFLYKVDIISLKLTVPGSKFGIGSVDRNQDPLAVGLSFEDKLVVCDDHVAVDPVAESIARPADIDQFRDESGQLIWLRLLEAGAQGIIIIRRLDAFLAPLAAIVDARDARHAEEEPVGQRQVFFVCQDARDPGHIVVVDKIHQMLASVDAPLLRTVLTVQGVRDLEHVHAVEA